MLTQENLNMKMTNSNSNSNESNELKPALRFITCGSVDDGKSTLIGRLLVDSKAVLQDHLAGVQRQGSTDLALLTDGLVAEREQGITIDVAYRYFSTEQRKFIIGDAPGHEQYTRNMITAASSADAAVVLVDANKLDWKNPQLDLLVQTRRHTLLVNLLRVPSLIFAINKLDAVSDPALAFKHISAALVRFTASANVKVHATVPISALKGWNVVDAAPKQNQESPTSQKLDENAFWCNYDGESLLSILEHLPITHADVQAPFAFPVQWVEKFSDSGNTEQGRRVFWGRIATGKISAGDNIQIAPSGQTATVSQILTHTRETQNSIEAGHSAGLVLNKEVDVSRGDWLIAPNTFEAKRTLDATVAWLDDEPLILGRVYWALHGHRWVKAKISKIVHRLNINTLEEESANELPSNAIGHIEIQLQEAMPVLPFAKARHLGALILVDTASHKTAGAVLLR